MALRETVSNADEAMPAPAASIPWFRIGLFVLVLGLLIARRPEVLTQPQFYGEDGEWFGDAHTAGIASLVAPGAGYLVVFIRVAALLAAPLGLVGGARAYSIIGLIVQALPALFLASPRLRTVVRDDRARAGLALLLVLLPNAELTGNLTNTQWHLALLGFLVLIADRPANRRQRWFDIAALAIAAFTGPYALLLLPLAGLYFRKRLDGWRRLELAVLVCGAAIQLAVLLLTHGAERSHLPLGASPSTFVVAVASQLLFRFTPVALTSGSDALAAVIVAAAAAVLLAGVRAGGRELRSFVALAVAVTALGLLMPTVGPRDTGPVWVAIGAKLSGARYFFLLVVAIDACLLTLATRIRWANASRWAVAAVVALLCVSAASEWRYTPLPDEHLAAVQAQLDHGAPGTEVTIALYPPGYVISLRSG